MTSLKSLQKFFTNLTSFFRLDECIPYSLKACENAIEKLGLSKGGGGYEFDGYYGRKGCYAYKSGSWANMAFYGIGGTDDDMKKELDLPEYRPTGHDCGIKGMHILQISLMFLKHL